MSNSQVKHATGDYKSQKLNILAAARDASGAYGRNPQILVPAFILILSMFLVHEMSKLIVPYLQTTAANITWTFVATVIQLGILAYCLSAILVLSTKVTGRKISSFSNIFILARKRTLTMFGLLLLNLILFMLLNSLALYLGKSALFFNSSVALATLISVWVLGFFGGIIFLAFANVLCVTDNLGVFASIRASAQIVMRNYLVVSILSIVFFAAFYFINLLPSEFLAELIKSLVFLPYFALFLVYLLRRVQKDGLHTG